MQLHPLVLRNNYSFPSMLTIFLLSHSTQVTALCKVSKKKTCTHRLKFYTRTQCSMYLATSKSTTKKWKCRWCMVNASWQFPQFWLALYHTNLLMLNWYDLPPLSVKCWWHAKFRVHSFLFRQRRWLASCQIHTTLGLSMEFHSMGASFLFRRLAECSDLNTVTQGKIVNIVPHVFT